MPSSASAPMIERASADVRLQPGDLIGSGTVGTGCLLEVKDERFGRWLEPGDVVTLTVERLGDADHAHRRTTGGPMSGESGRRRRSPGWPRWSGGWRSTPRGRCHRA